MPSGTDRRPPCSVVTGVSGTGKTTLARLLAERLEIPFAEADDLHPPANIAKMSAGVPLTVHATDIPPEVTQAVYRIADSCRRTVDTPPPRPARPGTTP